MNEEVFLGTAHELSLKIYSTLVRMRRGAIYREGPLDRRAGFRMTIPSSILRIAKRGGVHGGQFAEIKFEGEEEKSSWRYIRKHFDNYDKKDSFADYHPLFLKHVDKAFYPTLGKDEIFVLAALLMSLHSNFEYFYKNLIKLYSSCELTDLEKLSPELRKFLDALLGDSNPRDNRVIREILEKFKRNRIVDYVDMYSLIKTVDFANPQHAQQFFRQYFEGQERNYAPILEMDRLFEVMLMLTIKKIMPVLRGKVLFYLNEGDFRKWRSADEREKGKLIAECVQKDRVFLIFKAGDLPLLHGSLKLIEAGSGRRMFRIFVDAELHNPHYAAVAQQDFQIAAPWRLFTFYFRRDAPDYVNANGHAIDRIYVLDDEIGAKKVVAEPHVKVEAPPVEERATVTVDVEAFVPTREILAQIEYVKRLAERIGKVREELQRNIAPLKLMMEKREEEAVSGLLEQLLTMKDQLMTLIALLEDGEKIDAIRVPLKECAGKMQNNYERLKGNYAHLAYFREIGEIIELLKRAKIL